MQPELESRLEQARSASGDALKSIVQEAGEQILHAALENPNFGEQHVTLLLDRLDLPVSVLSVVADTGRWVASKEVQVRLARHPRTPKRIALATVRHLYLFDLVRLSLLPSAPADIKRAAEEMILKRLPHLPVGEKLALARRGPSRVAGAILVEGHRQAIALALANPFLAESQVLKVLANTATAERAVLAIAQHPKWSCQYNVRMALIRNPATPVPCVLAFLPHLALRDLQETATLEGLAPDLRILIERELSRRNLDVDGRPAEK
jgi:hypothetical protein